MNRINLKKGVLGLVLAAWLVSCGGGADTTASGGTGGTGISSGTITGFGSVIVNDIHFDYDSAAVVVNDETGTGSTKGLKVGMTVKVKGTFDADGLTGSATDIEATHEVEGQIDSIDATANTFVVLGQVIRTDGETLFDGIPDRFAGLALGMKVEVYGLRNGNVIQATLVELESDADFEPELRGVVDEVTPPTFRIGNLTIGYDDATQAEHGSLDDDDLRVGALVEVHLDMGSAPPRATVIEFEDNEDVEFQVSDGSKAELEGYVTQVVSETSFEVGGHAVQTNAGTVYTSGVAGDIAVGRKVGVKGTVSGDVVVASKVEFK